jgi:glucose/arabinose dehydrogenase
MNNNTTRITAASWLILAAGLATPAAFAQSPFLGEWIATAHTPGGETSETLSVVETDDGYAIAAKLVGPVAAGTPVAGPGTDIVLEGDSFSYQRTVTVPEGSLVITYTGVVSGDTFTGMVDLGFAQTPYTGVRMGAAGTEGQPAAAAPPPSPAAAPADSFLSPYAANCSVCHGAGMEGAPQGTPLVGSDLRHGESTEEIARSIADGVPNTPMPAWSGSLSAIEIQRLAIYIGEQRANLTYTDFKVASPLEIPAGPIASERHDFRIETVATGIDRLPYSIAPLPDGSILLTEKAKGLRVVAPDGTLSEPIRGAPQAHDDGFQVPGILLVYGLGWLMDVAPHPDYAENGWIYLMYGDRCVDCNTASRAAGNAVSMNSLIRGRIANGAWVDQETIWQADIETYTAAPDMAAGGRIAFDDAGHVFFTVGIKGLGEQIGVQDLALPYGKIHRVDDDGSIPADNPFANTAGALPSIWSFGHRSPQGLEFNRATGQLWGTEMGQRGGDEVNLLRPGRNYGWPLVSLGLKYDGTPVDYGKDLGLAVDLAAIEQPVVDLTPSPAVSSFIFYDGAAFPAWRDNLLVGTLKATDLYRMVVEGERVVHTEVLLRDLARIRDIEQGYDGSVYLLIEHESGGQILRIVPVEG